MTKKSPAKKTPSDLLGSLVASASPKQPAAQAKKDNIQNVNPEMTRLVEEYTASALIAQIAEQQKKADEVPMKEQGMEAFLVEWAKEGHKPENPVFKTHHASVRLQVKGPYKVALPPGYDLTLEKVQEALPAALPGVVECVKVEQNLTCRALDKMLDEGTDEEKEAAQAAIKALSGLSAKHKALVLETKLKLTVDHERLGMVLADACNQNLDLMRQVLTVLVPQLALSNPKNEKALEMAQERFRKAAEPVAKAA